MKVVDRKKEKERLKKVDMETDKRNEVDGKTERE